MKFDVTGLEFSKGLTRIARRVTGTRYWHKCQTFKAVGEVVTVSWTDTATKFSVDLPATVEEEGTEVFQGRLLVELIRSIAAPRKKIRFESVDGPKEIKKVRIKSVGQTVNLNMMALDGMPVVDPVEGKSFTIPREIYNRVVAQVVIAAAVEDIRPVLAGVKFELDSEDRSCARRSPPCTVRRRIWRPTVHSPAEELARYLRQ